MAIGVCLGIGSVLADGVVPGRALTTLGNIISPWVLAAFMAGRLAASLRGGCWAGTTTLVTGVATYYAGGAFQQLAAGNHAAASLHSAAPLVWLIAAAVLGPVMGVAGAASTRSRPAVPAVIAPATVLVAEALYLILDRRPWRWNLSQEVYRFADVAVFAVLVTLAWGLPYLLISEATRRRRAYALLIACGVAGTAAIGLLYRLLRALA